MTDDRNTREKYKEMREIQGNYIEIQGNEREIQGNEGEIQGNEREIQGIEREIQGNEREIQGNDREIQGNDREMSVSVCSRARTSLQLPGKPLLRHTLLQNTFDKYATGRYLGPIGAKTKGLQNLNKCSSKANFLFHIFDQ